MAHGSQQPTSSAMRALALEYKSLQEEPVEGFRVKLANDDNMFCWEVALFGPPHTLYEGGYFKAHLNFPSDYPYSPPTVKFLSKVWHPNVYENGDLCISILHPPIDDPQSGELPCERWNPTQSVRTILLSVISLLNEPNTSSPANVDASVMYRRWKDSKGNDKEYENIIRKQVSTSRMDAERDQVVVPLTLEDYCIKTKTRSDADRVDITDFYDDDYLDDDDDDESSDGGAASRVPSQSRQRPPAEPRPRRWPTDAGTSASVEAGRVLSAPATMLRPPPSRPPSLMSSGLRLDNLDNGDDSGNGDL